MIYLLLGKEMRDALHSNRFAKWCDFGGRLHPGETPEHGAAREFSEESLCVVDMAETKREMPVDHATRVRWPSFAHYQSYIRDALDRGQYTLRITVLAPVNGKESVSRVFFLKRVRWQPRSFEYFNAVRSNLLRIQRLRDNQQSNAHLVEGYLAMHPAVQLEKIAVTEGGLCHAPYMFSVNQDYLEKQQIMYWSLGRLEEVMQMGGTWKNQPFRHSFMCALRIIIDKLRDIYYPSEE